jgi:hypothetical protein
VTGSVESASKCPIQDDSERPPGMSCSLYKMTDAVLDNAVASIHTALAAWAIGVGEDRGSDLHQFRRHGIADARRVWPRTAPADSGTARPRR